MKNSCVIFTRYLQRDLAKCDGMRRARSTLVRMRNEHESFNTELQRNENTVETTSAAKGNIKEGQIKVLLGCGAVIQLPKGITDLN